jgi:hypothetical protein
MPTSKNDKVRNTRSLSNCASESPKQVSGLTAEQLTEYMKKLCSAASVNNTAYHNGVLDLYNVLKPLLEQDKK